MTATLQHRGPDDSHIAMSGPAGLGHTRLSILELSDLGAQPMWSRDGRFCLVYNGEVYNAPALREQLERGGAVFRGRSDTEVVLNALVQWGMPALARLNGMFALAIWDTARQCLTLARDRFGIKPLYYAPRPSGVAFGSEVKAVLASGWPDRVLDSDGLHEYLYYGNALGPRTLLRDVRRVLPGEWRTYDRTGSQSGRFWTLHDVEPILDSPAVAASTIRHKLEDAVARHLLSDVPVSALLSGGVDSAALVAFAAPRSSPRLQTFTVGFDFSGSTNEFARARVIADRFDTDHSEVNLTASSVPDLLERLVSSHDQPFGDAANLPLLMIADALAGSVKVVLQGDGGDEIFAGYRRYNMLAHHRFWERAAKVTPLVRLLPTSHLIARGTRMLHAMGQEDHAERMALLLTQEKPSLHPLEAMSLDVRRRLERSDPFARYRAVAAGLPPGDPVQLMLWTDLSILLPDIFLEKVDRPMMAHGVEVRVPFLDAELTAYALGLPSAHKVRRLTKKWILRKALAGVLPSETLNGRKTGFTVPYSQWLRGPLAGYAREVLYEEAEAPGLFNRATVERLLAEHTSGRSDHGFLLYKLLSLALWSRSYGVRDID